jgi:basic membrane lipoprotein Med (substrate-binding protein (PBP1-ABC) superfamily)
MRRTTVLLLGLAAISAFALPTLAQSTTATPEARPVESACLVTDVGKVNDGGFNQFTDEGMEQAAKEFDLKTTVIETQHITDYDANINVCLQEGYDVIVTVGYRLADSTRAAAEANPDRYFIGIDAYFADKPLPNLIGIQAREDQSGFIAGAMAALMSKSGTVAGVYGVEEPPVMRFRNGYEQGAKYINPNIKVLGLYIDDYNAPDRGAAAAEQFIGENADVIFGAGGVTGDGGILAAAQKGVNVIGVDQDEYYTAFGGGTTPGADKLISSAMKRVDSGTYETIKAIVTGAALPTDSTYTLTVENGGIDFAPPHDSVVPDEVTAKVNEVVAGLKDGSIDTGVDPISGNLATATEEPTMAATAEATP